jgi:ankyrin repeat protein
MLVGNKCDRVTEREVSTQEGHALARELGISFVEASAKNCINVEKSAYDVVRELRRERLRAGSNGVSSPSPGLPIKKTFWGGYKIPFLAEEKNTEKGRTKLLQGLVHSAKTNNEKALIAYIEAGADINGHLGSDGSALHASAAGGYSNIVNILLKNGAAMNALSPAGVPPLQVAAAEGHLAVVRLLLHKGAIIDQTSTLHGTALMAAASRGRAEVAHFLLKSRATVNISGGRYGNALQAAAWNGNPEVVEHLLDAGADINARGGGDCTALQMAAFVGKHKAIRVLLNRGADITINAPGGKYGTALKAANDGGHYEAVTLLLDSGGKDTPDEAEVLKKNEQLQSSSSLQTNSHQDHEALTQRIGASDSSLLLETQYAKSPINSDSQVQLEATLTGSFIRNEILTTSKSPKTTSGQHLQRRVHSVGFSTLLDTPTAVVE